MTQHEFNRIVLELLEKLVELTTQDKDEIPVTNRDLLLVEIESLRCMLPVDQDGDDE